VSRPSADRLPEQFAILAQFIFYVAQVFRPEAFDFGWASFLRCVDFDLFVSEETQT